MRRRTLLKPSKPLGFCIATQITAVSSLVRASSEVLMAYKDHGTTDVPISDTNYAYEALPNRNYSFTVQARTCAGVGLRIPADGECITDVAGNNFHVPNQDVCGSFWSRLIKIYNSSFQHPAMFPHQLLCLVKFPNQGSCG